MFLILNVIIDVCPNALTAIATSKLAPITYSTENTFFIPYSDITFIEFTNIL